MELKGSKTEANLKTAFAGESEARNKYTYYASVAKKEGYEQIAALFLETAGNEKEHANFGLNSYMAAQCHLQQKTFWMQQWAKIMNGQICMQTLQKKQKKRALTVLLIFLREWQRLKRNMKRDIASF